MSAAAVVVAASILVGGLERRYLLSRPSAEGDSGIPRPIVLVLHGHMSSAGQAFGRKGRKLPLSYWETISGREGVLVAALDGERGADGHQGWNDCRSDAADNPKTDDVAFASAVARRLIKEEKGDPARIYAMGMSNGAMMAVRLALEMDPPPAAFASVGGSMAAASVCPSAKRPVSALFINGTKDPLVPYAGGTVGFGFMRQDRGTVLPVEQSAAVWRAADKLSGTPVAEPIAGTGPTRATRLIWGADPEKPQVELLRVDGGGHAEPSRQFSYWPLFQLVVGKQNRDVESAEEAWVFFKDKRASKSE